MTLTSEEKNTLQDERTNDPLELGLPGCSAQILKTKINAEGSCSDGSTVVPDRAVDVTRNTIRKQLSIGAIAGLRSWLDAGADNNAVAVQDLWQDSSNLVDLAFSQVRNLVTALGPGGYDLWTSDEVEAVLALGEVGQSRAQELIGRNITLNEAQEVVNG